MACEPTRGATASTGDWAPRLGAALGLRAAIVGAPVVVSLVATWLLADLLPRWDGTGGLLLWVLQLAMIGIGVAVVVERLTRRLVPLSHLLRLSLVFPDQAPSRFGVALRTGTIKQQQRIIANVRDHGFSADDLVAFEQLVAMVMALGHHERLTRGHTERVRAYSDLIGEQMALPHHDRAKLHWAALLHDVGKLAVPSEILALDGRPSEEQWKILQQHPRIGGEMVEPFADWLGEWRLAARDHHERWDGTGYPSARAGLDISLAGRIVAVADAYDVITSARSYKTAMKPEAARRELVRCSGTQFDPAVVEAMLRVSVGDLRAIAGRFGWAPAITRAAVETAQGALGPALAAGLAVVPLSIAQAGASAADGLLDIAVAEVATAEADTDPSVDDDAEGAAPGEDDDPRPDVSELDPGPPEVGSEPPADQSPDPGLSSEPDVPPVLPPPDLGSGDLPIDVDDPLEVVETIADDTLVDDTLDVVDTIVDDPLDSVDTIVDDGQEIVDPLVDDALDTVVGTLVDDGQDTVGTLVDDPLDTGDPGTLGADTDQAAGAATSPSIGGAGPPDDRAAPATPLDSGPLSGLL